MEILLNKVGYDLWIRETCFRGMTSLMNLTSLITFWKRGLRVTLVSFNSLKSADFFRPDTSTQTFRFAVTDYTAAIFFPRLLRRYNGLRLVYQRKLFIQRGMTHLMISALGKWILR